MLVLTRKRHEIIRIGPDIAVQIVEIQGGSVRVGIEAPADVAIVRDEIRGQYDPPTTSERKRRKRR